jgi:hypothetical protein
MSPSNFAAKRDEGFKHIEKESMLQNAGAKKFNFSENSASVLGVEREIPAEKFCICGLPCLQNEDICLKCRGDGQTHIEGEILKK